MVLVTSFNMSLFSKQTNQESPQCGSNYLTSSEFSKHELDVTDIKKSFIYFPDHVLLSFISVCLNYAHSCKAAPVGFFFSFLTSLSCLTNEKVSLWGTEPISNIPLHFHDLENFLIFSRYLLK